mmetsp:Transcript_94724/g.277042  ORF Transcript_94724/g.277042 Transcript_94724/m.277042 type:complete len:1325 (+) Transcript_94724:83-4057(+)
MGMQQLFATYPQDPAFCQLLTSELAALSKRLNLEHERLVAEVRRDLQSAQEVEMAALSAALEIANAKLRASKCKEVHCDSSCIALRSGTNSSVSEASETSEEATSSVSASAEMLEDGMIDHPVLATPRRDSRSHCPNEHRGHSEHKHQLDSAAAGTSCSERLLQVVSAPEPCASAPSVAPQEPCTPALHGMSALRELGAIERLLDGHALSTECPVTPVERCAPRPQGLRALLGLGDMEQLLDGPPLAAEEAKDVSLRCDEIGDPSDDVAKSSFAGQEVLAESEPLRPVRAKQARKSRRDRAGDVDLDDRGTMRGPLAARQYEYESALSPDMSESMGEGALVSSRAALEKPVAVERLKHSMPLGHEAVDSLKDGKLLHIAEAGKQLDESTSSGVAEPLEEGAALEPEAAEWSPIPTLPCDHGHPHMNDEAWSTAEAPGGRCLPFEVVFVFGTHHSGTTLLTNILGMHSKLTPLYETDFITDIGIHIQQLQPAISEGGQARQSAIRELQSLTRDVIALWLQRWHNSNEIMCPDERARGADRRGMHCFGKLFQRLPSFLGQLTNHFCSDLAAGAEPIQALTTFCDTLFAVHSQNEGRTVIINKTPSYSEVLPLLVEMYPDAKFLHCVRDGRDVACSIMQRPYGPTTIEEAALWWAARVQTAVKWGRANPANPHDAYFEVLYEDLVRSGERTLSGVLQFLGKSDEVEATLLPDSSKVRSAGKVGMWQSLPVEDLHVLERIAGSVLDHFGYQRASWPEALAEVSPAQQARAAAKASHMVEDGYSPAIHALDLQGSTDLAGPCHDAGTEVVGVQGSEDTPELTEFKKVLHRLRAVFTSKDVSREVATPLLLAACAGQLEVVRHLRELRADKDKAADGGVTPLQVAAAQGHLDVVKYLCQHDTYQESSVQNGLSSLHLASLAGHLGIVECLWTSGGSRDLAAADGSTAVHCAVSGRHIDVLQFLCRAGAMLDQPRLDGISPLGLASSSGNVEAVRCLCEARATVDQTGPDSDTPLTSAIVHGNAEIVQCLCRFGADTEYSKADRSFPLEVAVYRGHSEITCVLCDAGADQNRLTKSGESLVALSIARGHTEVLSALCAARAEKDGLTCDGQTPLSLAIRKGHVNGLQVLCAAGADIEKADIHGNRPMHTAALHNSVNALRSLCEARAQVDSLTAEGWTPLHTAVMAGCIEAIDFLCRVRSDPGRRRPDGVTPLHLAAGHGHLDALHSLCRASADAERPGCAGESALRLAARTGHEEAACCLCEAAANVDTADHPSAPPVLLAARNGLRGTAQQHGCANAGVSVRSKFRVGDRPGGDAHEDLPDSAKLEVLW